MKRARKRKSESTPKELSFRGGVRGKYAVRYAQGDNVVLLDPDVAEMFPDSRSVNRALRAIRSILQDQQAGRRARREPSRTR